jgi:alkylation response protein AidB-like acyl-CoA dehydrogenase
VRAVGRGTVARYAGDVDRQARNPVEGWQALRGIGALAMLVPRSMGGLGVDMVTYAEAISSLAQYCAATAMTVHMHSSACSIIIDRGDEGHQREAFGRLGEGLSLIGAWTSEPTSSVNVAAHHETTAVRDGDQYVINGRKHFCTMAGVASRALVGCRVVDPGRPAGQQLVSESRLLLVPAGAPGIEVSGSWDPMGMRGTVSPGVTLQDVRVPASALLRQGAVPASSEIGWLGFTAVLIGIATGALDAAAGYLARRRLVTDTDTRAHDRGVQAAVGGLASALTQARLAFEDASANWDDVAGRRPRAALAKLAATDAALTVTQECMAVVGGISVTRALTLERAYRDVRTVSLMPPNRQRLSEMVGAARLGI